MPEAGQAGTSVVFYLPFVLVLSFPPLNFLAATISMVGLSNFI
jgi:hypothetical protein